MQHAIDTILAEEREKLILFHPSGVLNQIDLILNMIINHAHNYET